MMSLASPSQSSVLEPFVADIDRALAAAIRGRGFPLNLEEAIRYATSGGGKRLRPGIVLLACEAVGGQAIDAMPAAVAVEFIHTFSLVHDDLPSMDDDAMRRGRPTLHIQAGEAVAVLAGDTMTSLAFGVLAEATALTAETRAAAVRELSQATNAMIAGQVLDTVGGFPHEVAPEQRLGVIHRSKTGALIRAAARLGAMCGEADETALDALTVYGEALGLMFQISDDLIDVEQAPEHAGKATRKDEAAGKLTYPGVHGVENSREMVGRLRDDATTALAPLGAAAEPLVRLCEQMAARTR